MVDLRQITLRGVVCVWCVLGCAVAFGQDAKEEGEPVQGTVVKGNQDDVEKAVEEDNGPGFFVQVDGGFSHLSDQINTPVFLGAIDYGLRAGPRWKKFDAFLEVHHNAWIRARDEFDVTRGVLNVTVGMAYRSFEDRVSSSLGVGTSTLLFDTFIDETWSTGLALNIRPAGLRWHPWKMALEFHPFLIMIMAPSLSGERLVRMQYQTALTLEWDSW